MYGFVPLVIRKSSCRRILGFTSLRYMKLKQEAPYHEILLSFFKKKSSWSFPHKFLMGQLVPDWLGHDWP